MSRARKVGVGFLVLVVLLVIAAFAADRIALGVAEDRLATQARQEMVARNIKLTGDPRVEISGFPFLTQVLGGEFEQISINVTAPETNGVKLNDLNLVASQVKADVQAVARGNGDVTAGRLTGTANMNWDAVRGLLEIAGLPGIDPSVAQISVVDNQIEVKVPLALLGQQLTIKATGTLQVEQGAVRLQITGLGPDGGTVPAPIQRLIDQYRDRMSIAVRVPELPYKLVVNRVESGPAGVRVVASADGVKLSG